ncbi:HutD family protein [Alphaproteobacteria bacterium KMM 3653]|uniref:HutD family protein n=1 Tax=Harenicola maris TaxID=2841044 RepID=A0AAP2CNE9_9RHOB|nr:HutD family protein [Harenicola maris]
MDHTFIQTDNLAVSPLEDGDTSTREIASQPGPKGVTWRFCVTDINTPLTLTPPPGFARILTVVDGYTFGVKTAKGHQPIDCCTAVKLPDDGPVVAEPNSATTRVFLVDYDPDVVSTTVRRLNGPIERNLITLGHSSYAVYGVMGSFTLAGRRGDDRSCILLGAQPAPLVVEEGSMVLVVRIDTLT